MGSFGENLRREREMRGVSLEEISSATKISIRFLQAIEAEAFSKLPGGIFTRSFMRAYAKYLGLDEERVLAEYQLVALPKPDVDLTRMTQSRLVPSGESSRASWLAVLIAALMLASGYLLFRYSRRTAEMAGPTASAVGVSAAAPSSPVQAQAPPASSGTLPSAPAGVAPAAPSDAPSAGTPTATAPAPALEQSSTTLNTMTGASAGEGLVLQVAATERAWVAVDADGKTYLQRVMNPNEVETLKAKESFDVTTGNAHGIILTLNGETLKPLGRRGEVKSVHLTRQDLKVPSP